MGRSPGWLPMLVVICPGAKLEVFGAAATALPAVFPADSTEELDSSWRPDVSSELGPRSEAADTTSFSFFFRGFRFFLGFLSLCRKSHKHTHTKKREILNEAHFLLKGRVSLFAGF